MPRFCNSAEKRRLMEALKGMKRINFVTSSSVPRGQVHVHVNPKVYQQIFQDKGRMDSAQPPSTLAELAKRVFARLTEVSKYVEPSRFGDSGKKLNYIIEKTKELHKDLQTVDGGFKSLCDPKQKLNFLCGAHLKRKNRKELKEEVKETEKQNASLRSTAVPGSNGKEEEAGEANACGGKNPN